MWRSGQTDVATLVRGNDISSETKPLEAATRGEAFPPEETIS